MPTRKNIAVLCGGQSSEHEVSIISAKNVIAALNPEKYIPYLVYINKQGGWNWLSDVDDFEFEDKHKPILLNPSNPAKPFFINEQTSLKIDVVAR